MLGTFFGLRARHFEDTGQPECSEPDYLLARFLFPRNRHLQFAQLMVSIQGGMDLFEPDEAGHPIEMATWLNQVVRMEPWKRQPKRNHTLESANADEKNGAYTYNESGREG
jgi:hypothetical protein